MKGWRPSACSIGSKPVWALLRANFLPDIGSIGLSFSASPSWARPGPRVPFRAHEAPRPRGRAEPRRGVHDKKGASPSPCSERPGELEMKTKETTHAPRGTGSADAARGLPQGRKRRKNKKWHGGRRNALITLDLAKENQGFPLLDFVRALLEEARIWRGFGFGLEKTWISFRRRRPFHPRSPLPRRLK